MVTDIVCDVATPG
ncbi:hypothetical protein A2U01_0076243 [Trifolium medium]|uniref:Uncharacterized protein n=1 Tax=Trifolium medium TaxID=97028 RepID=A0A392T1K0_9FABA|nr:hypothetical protein [Trifolium medium]